MNDKSSSTAVHVTDIVEPCPQRTLGLEKANRVITAMADICRQAKTYSTMWNVVSWSIDMCTIVAGLAISLQKPLSIADNNIYITVIGALLTATKTCEVLGSVKQRTADASMLSQSYTSAMHRAEDARDLMCSIAEGGITDEEKASWKKMLTILQSLMHFSESWAQNTNDKAGAELKSIVADLEEVEASVMIKEGVVLTV